MDKSNVAYLVKEIYEQDEDGVFKSKLYKRKVYVNITSVSMTEWFEGGRNGLNPTYRITMFGGDYNGEEMLEFKNQTYSIYRTYINKNDDIELYVQYKQGDADGKAK